MSHPDSQPEGPSPPWGRCPKGRGGSLLAYFSFFFAILFALLGLLLPPMGVIDASVNMLIAQLLVLCATLLGIKSFDFPSPQNKKP